MLSLDDAAKLSVDFTCGDGELIVFARRENAGCELQPDGALLFELFEFELFELLELFT